MSLVLIFIIAVIMYRILVSIPLFQNETLRGQANLIASTSSAMVNLILIMALGKVYEKLALKLTQWGMYHPVIMKTMSMPLTAVLTINIDIIQKTILVFI